MKICPTCKQTYLDESLNYCLIDGATLVPTGAVNTTETGQPTDSITNKKTEEYGNFSPNAEQPTVLRANAFPTAPRKSNNLLWILLALGGVVLLCGGGFAGLVVYLSTAKNNLTSSNPSNISVNANTDRNSVSNVKTIKPDADDPTLSGLTMEKYLRLDSKISYKEAAKILGSEGAELSNSGSGQYQAVMYKWQNNDSEFVILMFMNDSLNMRSQSGLSKRISPQLSLEKFSQIKNGTNYPAAAAILGEGDEQNKSTLLGMEMVTYQWKLNNYTYASLTFQNGKLTSKSQFGLK